MAAMLLVREGKLAYDQRLAAIFPEFSGYGRDVTVRHLLTHTSGLPDYEDLMKASPRQWTASRQIQDDEALRLLAAETSGKFAPGASWSYSNSGYVLLGLIVARVSGRPFAAFLHDRVFAPLGMHGTLVYRAGGAEPANRAFGHVRRADGFVESDQSATSATQGDGGVYSSLADLAKWDDALDRGLPIPREEMAAAFTPVRLAGGAEPHWPLAPGEDNLAPGKPVAYGYGWFLDPFGGRARQWHSGSTMGFRTVIQRFPAGRLSVVLLANRTDLDAAALALQAAAMALDGNRR